MNTIQVEVTATIDAPPQRVYAVLADYRTHHPNILPKPYFTSLAVEQGGIGAGTVVVAHMNVYGARRTYRLAVSEPQPGRVLVESDAEAGISTTFTVEPLDGGDRSRVTIATASRPAAGVAGWLERLINPAITRRIYRSELDQLNAYMQSTAAATT